MPLFVAEWTVDGMTAGRMAEFRRVLEDAADRVSSHGAAVDLVRCTHVPDQGRCIGLFEAARLDDVRSVNRMAQAPLARVGLAVELVHTDVPDGDQVKHEGGES